MPPKKKTPQKKKSKSGSGKGSGKKKGSVTPKKDTLTAEMILQIGKATNQLQSPINLAFTNLKPEKLPILECFHFNELPRKMKISNSGNTILLNGLWKCNMPYIMGGPLIGKYYFSQIHFHWGPTDIEGSEHIVDGTPLPFEMHAVFYDCKYGSHEEARKNVDGLVAFAYLFKIQPEDNPRMQILINYLPRVVTPVSYTIDAVPLSHFIDTITEDYIMYWGSVVSTNLVHSLLWFISRKSLGISSQQVDAFRQIKDHNKIPIMNNFRVIQELGERPIYHINPSKDKKTLLSLLPFELEQMVNKTPKSVKKDGKKSKNVAKNKKPKTKKNKKVNYCFVETHLKDEKLLKKLRNEFNSDNERKLTGNEKELFPRNMESGDFCPEICKYCKQNVDNDTKADTNLETVINKITSPTLLAKSIIKSRYRINTTASDDETKEIFTSFDNKIFVDDTALNRNKKNNEFDPKKKCKNTSRIPIFKYSNIPKKSI